MDVEKEREAFEAYMAEKYKSLMDRRQCLNNGGGYMAWDMNVAWQVWQAAKAQAVPEGFVLVDKHLPEQIAEKMAIDRIDKPRHDNDPVWSEIAEQSYKDQVKSKKWEFWRDYKAMIEAQEPTND